jgi:hypothetical protein
LDCAQMQRCSDSIACRYWKAAEFDKNPLFQSMRFKEQVVKLEFAMWCGIVSSYQGSLYVASSW